MLTVVPAVNNWIRRKL